MTILRAHFIENLIKWNEQAEWKEWMPSADC